MAEIAALAAAHPDALRADVRSFDIGGRVFDADACIELMGVVNLSRDSWYRESVSPSTTAAIERGRVLAAQGAMIIDIGAESTIPGAAGNDWPGTGGRRLPPEAGGRPPPQQLAGRT